MLAASSSRASHSGRAAADAELLLYLGEFEDDEGDFVDPMALDALPDQPGRRAASAGPADVNGTEKRDDTEARPD